MGERERDVKQKRKSDTSNNINVVNGNNRMGDSLGEACGGLRDECTTEAQ